MGHLDQQHIIYVFMNRTKRFPFGTDKILVNTWSQLVFKYIHFFCKILSEIKHKLFHGN